jgi:hypothetical protein
MYIFPYMCLHIHLYIVVKCPKDGANSQVFKLILHRVISNQYLTKFNRFVVILLSYSNKGVYLYDG